MEQLPTGTVTFLFTDLEESTSKWEKHPHAMQDALARHDRLLREAVDAHSGHVVKSTGDGVHAVFAAAPDAVLAAGDAVRAFAHESWDATGPLRVRVGIHTGKADERDGDYFGPTLNRASRLMAAAHGGQVVLSRVSADLVRDVLPDGLSLLDLGEHRLRGLERPEHVFELEIAGITPQFPPLQSLDAFPAALVLPAPSFASGGDGLADRRNELARLADGWQRARTGSRHVALVGGEPGIGKTRLAGVLAQRVHGEGGVVLYGRCDEDAIVPYQPFVEALRPCIAAYPTSTLHERLHGLEHDLARVFPELSGRISSPADPIAGDPEAERYRFFEAITTLITGITATRATALVLDDLHWADKPTLLLLRHVVRSAAGAALLLVACYRDVEVRDDHQLADLLADLRREPSVTRVGLTGLSADDSGDLLRAITGRHVAEPLISALHRETDGNPFFVEELLRHLVETGVLPRVEAGGADADLASLDLPESVREVIARRLRRLPPPVNEVLKVGAIVGRDFDAAVIARAARTPTEQVLTSLDHATEAGVVREDPDRLGRYTFSHALIRQTLNAGLGTAARARLHAQVGTALEDIGGSGRTAAQLAFHFTRAVGVIGAEKAINYTTRAGHDAIADLAFEDAADYFERALRLVEQHEPAATTSRIDLLTDLASALVYVDEQAGVETALRAVDAARQDGTPVEFGRAVAVAVEPVYGLRAYPTQIVALFDEARTVLGDGDPALRARLLAFEAFKYATHMLHGREGCVLAEEAVALARQSNDPVTLADALYALAVSLEGAADLTRRTALGDELVALGGTAGPRASAYGLRVLAGAHLERADADALTSTIGELGRIGVELRWLPAHAYTAQFRATQALLEGRFDAVRTHGEELRRYARAYRGAAGMHFMQFAHLAREQGEFAGRQLPLQLTDESAVDLYTWATLALLHLEAGDDAAARRTLDPLTSEHFRERAKESGWGSALGMLAEVVAKAGTPAHAATLYDLLTPFSGRLLTVVLGLACLGAADRYLGMLSTVLERWEEADEHFDRALTIEQRARGHALLPRTRYWQVRRLLAQGRPSDRRAANDVLAVVIDDASRLGMQGLRAQADALRAG